MAIGINWAEVWAVDVWDVVWQQTAVAAVDGGKDELFIDVNDLKRRVLVAENNRRAALLVAIAEAEDLP